jgi:hypothetical protein
LAGFGLSLLASPRADAGKHRLRHRSSKAFPFEPPGKMQ